MKLNKQLESLDVPQFTEDKGIDALCEYIPILTVVLRFVKIFTNEAGDARIDALIEWLNSVCSQDGRAVVNIDDKD